MHPPRMSAPSCIVPPTEQLVIRPYLVPLLPTFHGMESENPYAHIKEFEDVCNTFQEGGASIDLMRLKLFPFTLKDKAKIWLNSLRPRSIRTWTDLQAEFLKKFFPTHRTNGLKRQISNFLAKENEKFYECWERYMEAINACPHHATPRDNVWRRFHEQKSEEAMDFLSYVADVSRGWDELTKGEVGKMKSQLSAFNAKAGMYTLKEDDDMKAKLVAVTRRLEELERSGKKIENPTPSHIEELLKEEILKKSTSPPFPQALHGKKGIRNASEILEAIETSESQYPMQDMIKQVPTYAKFLKDLSTIKRGLTVNKKAFLTEQVVEKALLDLGASVNLLPYSVYKQLGLDVLVQVDNFYYPVDFIVLDTYPTVKEANLVPIILGRPFLATSNAIINCRNGLMQLTFGNITLDLNIFYMSKKQTTPEEEKRRIEEILPLFNKEEEAAAEKETPKLNLKPLPVELKYTYLEENNQCPVIISSSLTIKEKSLLEVLKSEEAKPIRQLQRRLNPHLQEVVRAEVLKLLQAGKIIFHCHLSIKFWKESLAIRSIVSWTANYGVFMDDITVYGGTYEECFVNLEAVFTDALKKLGAQLEKCHFMVCQGIVLGHIISEKGIEIDKAKVDLIVKLPSPITVKGVRQILGHAGFYRRFIKDFSSLSKPLCELLAKDAKFIWDERCQNSFDQLKKFLTTTPIVRAPNWQLPFELMCDVSEFAIGAVLGQREDGKPYVIYYPNKTLNEAQRNYTTTEKELLVVEVDFLLFWFEWLHEWLEMISIDSKGVLAIGIQ
ncbi:Retrovirus-related Pol polyprotein from transposon opus [Vitis vinifera]|uniref:Retrovirus-related Pol polyprotein from transposon opus n=1 Tax=Vitis vinifera TaxID=29760 RepID=A0A438FFT6_VITVI|nr:Retrovirus-related Pol polyprotein from transposon opus [Vitis vinifera]